MSATTIYESICVEETSGQSSAALKYVRSMTPEDKDEVLVALLEEVLEMQEGHGPIFFFKNGKDLGYWVTPSLAKAYHDEKIKSLPTGVLELLELSDSEKNPSGFAQCFTEEEACALVRARESQ